MSHFSVLVRGIASSLDKAQSRVNTMLAPYNENLTGSHKPKWDKWVLGGRWSGLIKLKSDSGRDATAPTGINLAFAKNIDFAESHITTFAVLDEEGWHERTEVGWFGMTFNGSESSDVWALAFHDRFLSELTPDTFIAIVDCHF